MKILDINFHKPDKFDLATAIFLGGAGGLFGVFLQPVFGGDIRLIFIFIVTCFLSSLVSVTGASFDKAGFKGMFLSGLCALISYLLLISLF